MIYKITFLKPVSRDQLKGNNVQPAKNISNIFVENYNNSNPSTKLYFTDQKL